MADFNLNGFEDAVASLPSRLAGPGGVVGVVKDGEILMKRAWGYADPDARLAMTDDTLLPICSISKQFTCALLLGLVGDTTELDDRLTDILPLLAERPSIAQLCHNQSGLRDYWALTVLHGAPAEGRFLREDARPLFARMRTGHFAPGSHYSYSNGNFRILLDMVEDLGGEPLSQLLWKRIFEPAGMQTAILASDTAEPLNGAVGYEGNADVGFFPAVNRIYWAGDAGIAASLNDMLNWERFIDRTRDDPDGIYRQLSAPQTFSDGNPAQYGFGLVRETIDGMVVTGHGGALRGFRCRRLHVASHRLSVVVMLNHEGDAHGAALAVMKAALGMKEPAASHDIPDAGWRGHYLEPISGLVLDVDVVGNAIKAQFAGGSETLKLAQDGIARSASMTLTRTGDAITIERPGENLKGLAARINGAATPDIEGQFYSAEIDGWLSIAAVGGAFFGGFEGFLGTSTMYPIAPVGEDIWQLSCRRSMDAPAPGYWTIRIRRDESGMVRGLTIGCWLARNVDYEKAAPASAMV